MEQALYIGKANRGIRIFYDNNSVVPGHRFSFTYPLSSGKSTDVLPERIAGIASASLTPCPARSMGPVQHSKEKIKVSDRVFYVLEQDGIQDVPDPINQCRWQKTVPTILTRLSAMPESTDAARESMPVLERSG